MERHQDCDRWCGDRAACLGIVGLDEPRTPIREDWNLHFQDRKLDEQPSEAIQEVTKETTEKEESVRVERMGSFFFARDMCSHFYGKPNNERKV